MTIKARLLDEQEKQYHNEIRALTDEGMAFAMLLHSAAFDGRRPTIPAPVYVAQATWLQKQGYRLVKEEDNADTE